MPECIESADDFSSCSGRASRELLSSSGDGIDPTEKNVQNKATVEVRNALFDRRNSLVNKSLSARRSTRGVKPKPTLVVASRSIRLDDQPVAMGGAGEGIGATNPAHSVESHD
jgi:hypothetical protein